MVLQSAKAGRQPSMQFKGPLDKRRCSHLRQDF